MTEVGEKLRQLVEAHGQSLWRHPQRAREILSELGPAEKREANVLAAAASLGVPAALLADPSPSSRAELRRKLIAELAMTGRAARWAVDTWAYALGTLPGKRRKATLPPARAASRHWWRRHRFAFAVLLLVIVAGTGLWGYVRLISPVELRGHEEAVQCVAFSAGGTTAVSAGRDGTIRVWDLETRREIRRLSLQEGVPHEVAFSPDGRRILSCSGSQVQLWDVQAAQPIRLPGPDDRPGAPRGPKEGLVNGAFSPDGQTVLVGSAATGRIETWRLDNGGRRTFRWEASADGRGVAAFRPGWRQAVFAGGSGQVMRLWDLDGGVEVGRFEVHTRGVTCLAFSPDGKQLVTGDRGGVVRLWDVATARGLLGFSDHRGAVKCVAFASGGKRLLSADASYLVIRDTANGKRIGRYDLMRQLRLPYTTRIESVAISGQAARLLAGCGDGVVRLWPLPRPAGR